MCVEGRVSGRSLFIQAKACDVACWPKADMVVRDSGVAFRGRADLANAEDHFR
jgi:hypothetical protein